MANISNSLLHFKLDFWSSQDNWANLKYSLNSEQADECIGLLSETDMTHAVKNEVQAILNTFVTTSITTEKKVVVSAKHDFRTIDNLLFRVLRP